MQNEKLFEDTETETDSASVNEGAEDMQAVAEEKPKPEAKPTKKTAVYTDCQIYAVFGFGGRYTAGFNLGSARMDGLACRLLLHSLHNRTYAVGNMEFHL